MRKILTFIFFISLSINSQAQLTIKCIFGNSTIVVGQTATFSSSAIAQCENCYDWDINGNSTSSNNQTVGNVKIINSDLNQEVQIKGLSVGPFTLSLTYFDEEGCHTCSISGNVVSGNGPTPLPTQNCFGFDPVQGNDVTPDGVLNYGYIGSPYQSPLPSVGLSFTWYFKFKNGNLLTFYTQNPTFRELCPTNPVKSFAVIVSNGVQTKQYRSIQNGYPIPGITSLQDSPTCFLHADCEMGTGEFYKNNQNAEKIIVTPNPTSSTVSFIGSDLSNYSVSIIDFNGAEVIKKSKIEKSISLDKLKEGIYIYTITDENGYKQIGKIIKE